ncbi:MAG TPA: alpha/beta hydrolase-fold protein [Polyangiaceae bacterium]|nr:alpha/beta hydrolase-fold protein [Polyangiaceae bacterium]
MHRTSTHISGLALVLGCALFGSLTGCSSSSDTNPNTTGSNAGTTGVAGTTAGGSTTGGSGGTSNSGAAGTAAGGSAGTGGTGGATPSAGAAGTAGAAGANAGGSAGTAGSAGAAGSGGVNGCEEAGSVGKTGRQCDPGDEGDGTFDQMEPPGDNPPEANAEPMGMMTEGVTFDSAEFGYGFSYQVYVPAEYEAGKPAALMVFQDGGNYPVNFRVPSVFDTLIAAGDMPVTIGIFINPGEDRSFEYDSTTPKYADFLINELIPALEVTYDFVDDPNGWGIGGHSSGGSCAFTAGWNYPDKFRKIMTHSGSFIQLADDPDPGADDYRNVILTTMPIKPLRVTMSAGINDLECCGDTWRNANDETAMSLETAGYHYRYMQNGGSHDVGPWGTYDIANALRWLWRGYTLPHYDAP